METRHFISKFEENKLLINFVKGGRSIYNLTKLYKRFIKFIKKLSREEWKKIKSIKIYLDLKIKKRNKMMLVYSILKSEEITKFILEQETVKLSFLIEEGLKLSYSNYHMFLFLDSQKDRFDNKIMDYFISDYLAFNLDGDINNIFFSTIESIITKDKEFEFLRLPNFYVAENIDEIKVKDLIESLRILKNFKNFKFLTLNITYKANLKKNCKVEYLDYQKNFLNIIFTILSVFTKECMIINFSIIDVDECFPLCMLFEALESCLKTLPNKKFLVNLRSLCHINHSMEGISHHQSLDNGNLSHFMIGKSIFINKIFSKVENYDLVYLFYFITKYTQKLQRLNKKYILLFIGRFMVHFDFYYFDRRSNSKSEISSVSAYNYLPRKLKHLFKNIENLEETKLLLFSKGYNPLTK